MTTQSSTVPVSGRLAVFLALHYTGQGWIDRTIDALLIINRARRIGLNS